MFVACPAPIPYVFVGVLTARKIKSASAIVSSIFVLKNKFGARAERFA